MFSKTGIIFGSFISGVVGILWLMAVSFHQDRGNKPHVNVKQR
jgi:hypothetical protein